jgi:hypothetical protein
MNNGTKERMQELMVPIDTSIQLTNDQNELLMVACAMMQRSKEIFEAVLGDTGRKKMFKDYAE